MRRGGIAEKIAEASAGPSDSKHHENYSRDAVAAVETACQMTFGCLAADSALSMNAPSLFKLRRYAPDMRPRRASEPGAV
jgi:hypothetical protein